MAALEAMVPLKGEGGGKLNRSSSHGSNANLALVGTGEADTLEYRIKAVEKEGINKGKKEISLWHDITLVHVDPATDRPTPYLNFVCEIPKFTRKKYEIATDEVGNAIKQDEKKGKLREFKKGDIFFNYGCLPRTWEDPTFIHPDAEGCRGDNDPLDVCEIGAKIIPTGDVRPVKILGVLCMIDEGEADWKVVVIDAEDKWAPFLNDINDVEKHLPGQLSAIREWFRTYKIPDGKPPNVFGLDEKFMDKSYALEIIKECNHAWKELITGEKERKMEHVDDGVKKLVRKLSKSNLVDLAAYDDDEAPSF
jgi:inorganic pyrophosphatase